MPNYWHDHIHLTTPDALKTAQFYQTMFNAERVNTRKLADGRTSAEINLNGSRILIIEPAAKAEPSAGSAPTGYGIDHFGIRTDNIEAAVADLKSKGVKFRDEIRMVLPGIKVANLWAPENVVVELLERSG